MVAVSWYILKVLIVSGILAGYYFLALKDKVFHRWNRFYLLLTVCLSLLLPFVSINIFSGGTDQGNITRALQTITMQDQIVVEMGRTSAVNTDTIWIYGYLLISLFFIVRLISSLFQIGRMKKRYPQTKVNGVNFINTDEKGTPFSFFNDIFWNRSIDLHTTSGQQIFNHEVAHITEKHTYDKLFMNTILLLFWVNPFFWLIRKELNMIHEFIADKMALEDGDTSAFAEMILSSVFTRQQFSITNNFFYSPIKRRLIMLSKNKHAKVNYISRLLVLPLATIVFIGISCKVKTDTESQKTPDEIVVTPPVEEQTALPVDSTTTLFYNNKTIKSFKVFDNKSESPVELTFEDGSRENISMEAAKKAGIPIPPPPPQRSIATMYNGKRIMYAVKSDGDKVILQYPDGSKETITLDQAKKANLKLVYPTKPTVKFTPPKVVKDTNIKFTPPRVVKDTNVQFRPPVFVKIDIPGSAGGRISLQNIETAKKLEPGSGDYIVKSFTVYFSGAGFPHVKSYTQTGGKFNSEIQKEWENIKPGTSVSFDNVIVKFKGEKMIKIHQPPGYIVY